MTTSLTKSWFVVIALVLLAGCVPPPGPGKTDWKGGPSVPGVPFGQSNASSQGGWLLGGKADDWAYVQAPVEEESGGFFGGLSKTAVPMMAQSASREIGFSVGGAKDIGNFRQNINESFLPIPTDITYEGLFYDYYFNTGEAKPCEKLFCPSYTQAISKDPISGRIDHYLAVGLNSGVADFKRKKQNVVVVLDISGSMSSPFDQYYYDQFGRRIQLSVEDVEGQSKSKIDLAKRSIVNMIDHLNSQDRLGIVLFDNEAYLAKPLALMSNIDIGRLKSHILEVGPRGSTNMEAGLQLGSSLFEKIQGAYDQKEYDNRIIFLTDAQPNTGDTTESGFLGITQKNARDKVYTTFIGIGVDFDTQLIESISKVRGANYYSVHSEKDFKKRLDNEFDFMVTPMVFDLRLRLDAPGYKIEKVYGSPQADESTGQIMTVDTLFPSAKEEGQTRGGIILLKLHEKEGVSKSASSQPIKLIVDYMDRNGNSESVSDVVQIYTGDFDRFDNSGIRKAVLLSRYADLLKAWVTDERRALAQVPWPVEGDRIAPLPSAKAGGYDWSDTEKVDQPQQPSAEAGKGIVIVPCISRTTGIIARCVFPLGQWERQSAPLRVMDSYKVLFKDFGDHFQNEMNLIGDNTMQKELDILRKLGSYPN